MRFKIKRVPVKRLIGIPLASLLFISLCLFLGHEGSDMGEVLVNALIIVACDIWFFCKFLPEYSYLFEFSDTFVTTKNLLGKVSRYNYSEISFEHVGNNYRLISKLDNKQILRTERQEEISQIEELINYLNIEVVKVNKEFNTYLNMPVMVLRQERLEPVIYQKSIKSIVISLLVAVVAFTLGNLYMVYIGEAIWLGLIIALVFEISALVLVSWLFIKAHLKEPERVELREDVILIKYHKGDSWKEVTWDKVEAKWKAFEYDEPMINIELVLHMDDGSVYELLTERPENQFNYNQILRFLTLHNINVKNVYGVHPAEGQRIEKYKNEPLRLKRKQHDSNHV